jgi:hypothetical protein
VGICFLLVIEEVVVERKIGLEGGGVSDSRQTCQNSVPWLLIRH